MSQILNPSGGGGGSSGIQTINGDVGSIAGSTVTIFANNATNNSGNTVLFNNSGTISTLNVSDSSQNTLIGNNSGGVNNLNFNTENTALGSFSLGSLTVGPNTTSRNIAIGKSSLFSLVGNAIDGANDNIALGSPALNFLIDGDQNIVFGTGSGANYTTNESNNILISNAGVTGESNIIRIGSVGGGDPHTANFQAGITGVTVAVSSPVAINSSGQLSDLGFGTAGQVLTSNGAATSPTWQSATAFRAHLNANTAANLTGDNTTVVVPFDTVDYDTDSGYNTGTSTYTIPTGKGGVYQINYSVFSYRTAGTNTVQLLNFIVNGVTSIRNYEINFENLQVSGELTLTSGAQYLFSAGDTVQITCDVAGNGTKNIGFAGTFCVFSMFKI